MIRWTDDNDDVYDTVDVYLLTPLRKKRSILT